MNYYFFDLKHNNFANFYYLIIKAIYYNRKKLTAVYYINLPNDMRFGITDLVGINYLRVGEII